MRHSRLTPEVQAFVDSGQLSEFDGDWIQNLPADKQLDAAKKCMKVDPVYFPSRDFQPSHLQKADRRGPFGGSHHGD